MIVFAQANTTALVLMAVAAAACGLLLMRTQRHFREQARRKVEPSGSPASRPGPSDGHSAPPGEAGRWEVQMHDLARELSARLDSKMGVLQHLILEADRASARLERALAAGRPAEHQGESGDGTSAPPTEPPDPL